MKEYANRHELYLVLSLSFLVTLMGCGRPTSKPPDTIVSNRVVHQSPTFYQDIAPVFYEHCSACHQEQGAGPFPLVEYNDIEKRANQIIEVIESGYMPPWLPKDGSFEFKHSPTLSVDDVDLLKQWIAAGKPPGRIQQLPNLARPSAWELGEPDLVVELQRPYTLAAEGADVYRNFVIPLELERDRYVRAFEFRPSNPKVVHHAFVLKDLTGQSRKHDAKDEAEGYDGMDMLGGATSPDGHLIAWLPSRRAIKSPDDMPWTLEADSDLVLQVHMQPSGRVENVSAKVAFYFTDRAPTKFPVKLSLFSATIDIPAGDNNYIVSDSFTLPVDVSALAVTAHAHYLGKRLQALATLPDGTTHHLLNIPEWDFNWQGVYEYQTPPLLPRGTRLEMRFQYDNSAVNPFNPTHPPKRVQYGPATTDEMAEVWLQVLPRTASDRSELIKSFEGNVAKRILAHSDYALTHEPNDVEAIIRKTRALLLLNRKTDARDHLQSALGRLPEQAQLHQLLGELQLLHLNAPDVAAESFHRALQIAPDLIGPNAHLGRIYFKSRRLVDAEKHFKAVPPASNDYPTALTYLGMIYVEKSELEAAANCFERCVEIAPTNKDYARNLELIRTLIRERGSDTR